MSAYVNLYSPRCQSCGCFAIDHVVDDEELRECAQCECQQFMRLDDEKGGDE
jgi:4-alpha-glucanotransferase